ncbi:hypothetical protein NKH33_09425 [Mesorhizobium sp. M1182]|uniref:hypothetical protein n=1 Tax=Mesorhizobium sp. M1182 TaxID=2957067 RepID=UPI00333D2C8B
MGQYLSPVLWLLLAISASMIALGNEDPFARDLLCGFGVCPTSGHASAWNKLAYDTGVGVFLSLVFYWLLVRVPEMQKRKRLKKSLTTQYRMFKQDCLATMVGVTVGAFKMETVHQLMGQNEFRAFFNAQATQDQNRWDAFQNKIQPHNVSDLMIAMEVFRDEIGYVLNNVDIESDEAFDFFQRLLGAIHSVGRSTVDLDDGDRLSGFLWQMFSGWDPVKGYRDHDIVARMIEQI